MLFTTQSRKHTEICCFRERLRFFVHEQYDAMLMSTQVRSQKKDIFVPVESATVIVLLFVVVYSLYLDRSRFTRINYQNDYTRNLLRN